MSLAEYRASPSEMARANDLLTKLPALGEIALDIGARDGHFSMLLADRFKQVFALDLVMPDIIHERVQCVQGNAADLSFEDDSIDFTFCAEVLEHIPTEILRAVCNELERVTKDQILIGVPYKQDIRVGRTTCYSCGGENPPWGHINTFDEARIARLFPKCRIVSVSFVGSTSEQTNSLSAKLMDLAGNPYGTYGQDEPCIHCGEKIKPPPKRNIFQKFATKAAFGTKWVSGVFTKPRGTWIHVLLAKKDAN